MKVLPFIICFFLLIISSVTGQNLCPNNSFENVTNCPTTLSQLSFAAPWHDAVGSTSTSDLFNNCNTSSPGCFQVSVPANFGGNAAARTGDGYAGIIAYYGTPVREYVQVALDSALVPGEAYRVEAYVRKSSNSKFAVDKIGILISSGPINQSGTANIPVNPQFETNSLITDTVNWTLITGIYIASGGEDNITIGNFRDNAGTIALNTGVSGTSCSINNNGAYYYIDDVKVEPINEKVIITGDTLICPGGSTTLFSNSNISTWWSTAALPVDTLSTADSITVSPVSTTTYILNGLFIKDSATVYIIQPPSVNLGPDTSICGGLLLQLDAFNTASTYLWSTGDTTASIAADQSQLYWAVTDNGGCTATDSVNITVLDNAVPDLGTDSVFCSNDAVPLLLDAGLADSYLWMPTGDTTRTLAITAALTYTVTVTHSNGCTSSSSVTTEEACPALVFIPKAFTPNNDGRNEFFLPILKNVLSYELKIFNRWGQLLFITENPETGWNGTFNSASAPAGSYVYMIDYSSLTDSQRIDKKIIRGSFLLIR